MCFPKCGNMYMWGAPSGDTVVLLGDFSYHMIIDSKTGRPVIGMNSLPDLKLM